MSPKIRPKLPRGMRDTLPREMILRQYVLDVIEEVFESFGYEPLQTPAIELAETLMGKYGPDAERMIYNVGHRGGKEALMLRYDLSVPLCRLVGQYPELNKPLKRYQIAPVWRAERPQRGRYREFYQCDVDVVGSDSMLADAEIIALMYAVLDRLGFPQFSIRLNNRKIINGIGQLAGVPDKLLGGLYRSIDKLDKIGLEGVRRELRKTGLEELLGILRPAGLSKRMIQTLVPLLRTGSDSIIAPILEQAEVGSEISGRLLAALRAADLVLIPDEVIDRLLEFLQIEGRSAEILAQLRQWLSPYPQALDGVAELEEILGYLEAMGVPESCCRLMPSMVRGLDYYTGPIYETVVEEPNIGSITGGGRYDELIGLFMDPAYPATGTTIGIERVIDLMEELDLFPPGIGATVCQVLVTQFSPEWVPESLKLSQELRRAGLNVEFYYENDPLGKQIRYALKKEIPYVAILGPDEAAAGVVTVRSLGLKQQETVPREEAAQRILSW